MTPSNRRATFSSFIWKLMERIGVMVMTIVIQLLLARLLMPADFGVIALVSVFVSLSNVLVSSGLATALIQKKTVDELDLNSVFYASCGVAAIFFAINFAVAPRVADLYNRPELTLVMRALALSILWTPLNIVQNALVSRGLLFKKVFFRSSLATLLSGGIGVWLALAGFGVWALVAQTVSSTFLMCALLWVSVRWRPSLQFSWARVRAMYSFSWKMLASSLVDTVDRQARTLIVGTVFSPTALGFFDKGQVFPKMIVDSVNGSVQSVLLPVLSARQDDRASVKSGMRRAMTTSAYFVFPAMAGLAAIAPPLVLLVLTDKWTPAVPFIQVFCGVYALWPIHTANLQAIVALGRSDVFLRLEVAKKIMGLLVLLVSIRFGPIGIAVGMLVSGVISSFINARPNVRLLDYRYREQVRDIAPALGLSILMGLAVWALQGLGLDLGLTLAIQVVCGVVLYFGASAALRFEAFGYTVQLVRELLRAKRPKRNS